MSQGEPTGRYAVLARHKSFVDQYACMEAMPGRNPLSLNAWITDDEGCMGIWEFRSEAEEHATFLGGLFKESRYRFCVVEERTAARWYIAEPETDSERRLAVGAVEQI
jgi:hypothetical protein